MNIMNKYFRWFCNEYFWLLSFYMRCGYGLVSRNLIPQGEHLEIIFRHGKTKLMIKCHCALAPSIFCFSFTWDLNDMLVASLPLSPRDDRYYLIILSAIKKDILEAATWYNTTARSIVLYLSMSFLRRSMLWMIRINNWWCIGLEKGLM